MNTENNLNTTIGLITEQLKNHHCSIFIGSGVSGGREGLPTAIDLVQILAKRKDYCEEGLSLVEACNRVVYREGVDGLRKFILEHIQPEFKTALPAHHAIAGLPFDAIITTNWDMLMEAALDACSKPYVRVINDKDITSGNRNAVPFVKLHGSVDGTETIIVTTSDYSLLHIKKPVTISMLRYLFSMGTVLFVGYSLKDEDVLRMYFELRHQLSGVMKDHYAIVLNPTASDIGFWESNGIKLINADATEFLTQLKENIKLANSPKDASELYLTLDIISRSLVATGTFPSASQVLDGALNAALDILKTQVKMSEIAQKMHNAFDMLIEMKPHYQALRQFRADRVPNMFPLELDPSNDVDAKERAKGEIEKLLKDREAAKLEIAKRGAKEIKSNDKILIFAQSTRVQAVIKTWLDNNADNDAYIELIVCECRPKSPTPFEDAISYIDGMPVSTRISYKVIPDNAVAALMAMCQINKVFFGAHSIIQEENDTILINALGSLMIATFAHQHGIPIYIFTESAKISSDNTEGMTPTAEEAIFPKRAPHFQKLMEGRRIKDQDLINPGFDKIPRSKFLFTLITELEISRTAN